MCKKVFTAITLFICIASVSGQPASVQQGFPTVGYKCPDVILQNIKYWDKDSTSIKSFRGKWLMLDFFNRICGACIKSFPHVDSIAKEYKDKMQVMMVGLYDHHLGKKETEDFYEKYREKENLSMPVAFDSALTTRWDLYTAPYVVYIDPQGIVRAITQSSNRKRIDSLLNGLSPKFPEVTRMHGEGGEDWPETKPFKNEFSYTSEKGGDSYQGPRFAIQNNAAFPMNIKLEYPEIFAVDDTLSSGQTSIFYEGDYRKFLQITSIYFDMPNHGRRAKTCAFRYKPGEIKDTLPMGDWIIHFEYDRGWKYHVTRIVY